MKSAPYELALQYGRQLWRYKWLSVALAWTLCAIGWTAVSLIPAKYESSARIYISADHLLTPILNGVAVNDDPARQVEYLQRTLLSRPNLEQVIHLSDLDLSSKRRMSTADHENMLQGLAHAIDIKLQTANLVTLTYRNSDPMAAKNVVNALLTVFSENSTGGNRKEMDNAKQFLNSQIESYENQLRAAERRRAEFHEKYIDLLPSSDGAASRLASGRAAVAKLQLDVADAQSKRDSMQHELEGVPKFLSVDAAGPQVIVSGKPTGLREQLDDARAKLEELKTRFTDEYPDVIALRKQIASLEARVAQAGTTNRNSEGRKTDVANPVYEQIKVRLVEAETTLASTQRALQQAQETQTVLEQKARETPGVQAQAQNLDRDYEIKKKEYDELLQRREQTLMTDAANTTADKLQFRIIDAPQIPVVPASPKQPLLLFAVFAGALGGAIGLPLLLLQFDKSFPTVATLRTLGLPVLGSVTRFAFPGRRRRSRIQIAAVCASASALVMIFGVLLFFSVGIYGLGIT